MTVTRQLRSRTSKSEDKMQFLQFVHCIVSSAPFCSCYCDCVTNNFVWCIPTLLLIRLKIALLLLQPFYIKYAVRV
ncbi:hypothetical protein RN001_004830 [Aquatica leii]|uniref:Uncharacterized protein n=1 Tax=Aquatica leii TaxID=1421715 RepID=A0AAN7PIY5_9COLE|nr:hypothetical protein RN001_004830 [Aquatica leii]